jgi:hypothetical protein
MTPVPRLGDWRTLTGPSGAWLAVAGDHVAAAGLDRLSVWRDGTLLLTATARTSAPGRPRFVAAGAGGPAQVYWATTVVDLAGAGIRRLDDLARAVVPEPVPRKPGHAAGSPRLTDLAWSADGSTVLVSRQESGPSRSLSASATLYRSTGEPLAELWRGQELGPVAGLVGPEWAVVGGRQQLVCSFDGSRLAVLDGVTPPRRIDTDETASRVLTVEAPMLRLWDTTGWELVAAAEGPWVDACLGPGGDWVLALDYDGRLQVLDAALEPVDHPAGPAAPGAPDGIAAGDRSVAAAIGGTVCSAALLG